MTRVPSRLAWGLALAGVAGCFSDPETPDGAKGAAAPEPPGPLPSLVGPEDFDLAARPGPEPGRTPGDGATEAGMAGGAPSPASEGGTAPGGAARGGEKPADTGSLVAPGNPGPKPGGNAEPPGEREEPRVGLASGGAGSEAGDPPGAVSEEDLLARLANGPDPSRALRDLITYHLYRHEPIRAHELVEEHRRHLDETDFDTLSLLALLYRQLGDSERAADYWRRAEGKLDPVKGLSVVRSTFMNRQGSGAQAVFQPTARTSHEAGDVVHVRIHLEGWAVDSGPDGYRVRQWIRMRIVDAAGKEHPFARWSGETSVDQNFSTRPSELHHTVYNVRLPYDLPPGPYAFEITVTDAGKDGPEGKAEARLEFEIVGP
ncbi:MAG: hypothetical protein HY720_15300 [Planctomycetes bacterium]|nr:hypothetical protein [Planctomycetota bacterium]